MSRINAEELRIKPEELGSERFRADHAVRYAYVAGSMYKGISSVDLVARMAGAGLLAYFGTGGQRLDDVERAIDDLRHRVPPGRSWGMNLLASLHAPEREERLVDVLLARGVRRVEASAYVTPSAGLVRYRLTGLRRRSDGTVEAPNRVLGKASRPEVAEAYLSPAPRAMVENLRAAGRITADEADLAAFVPLADDVCAEADSGGHTDQRQLISLLPEMVRLRDRLAERLPGGSRPRIGAAGGIGTPESVAAAFVLGADFVLTGSINQCTAEAGTSDEVKDLLAQAGVQDTAIVPAGDMLEIGAKAQVLRRGLFFPARANKLFDLYRRLDSLDDLDQQTRQQLETSIFRRSIDDIWAETAEHYRRADPAQLERAERDAKHRMALVFKWYFVQSTRLATGGVRDRRVDFQVACGPAMGALNSFLRGTAHQDWRNRHPDDLAELLMTGAADVLSRQLAAYATRATLTAVDR